MRRRNFSNDLIFCQFSEAPDHTPFFPLELCGTAFLSWIFRLIFFFKCRDAIYFSSIIFSFPFIFFIHSFFSLLYFIIQDFRLNFSLLCSAQLSFLRKKRARSESIWFANEWPSIHWSLMIESNRFCSTLYELLSFSLDSIWFDSIVRFWDQQRFCRRTFEISGSVPALFWIFARFSRISIEPSECVILWSMSEIHFDSLTWAGPRSSWGRVALIIGHFKVKFLKFDSIGSRIKWSEKSIDLFSCFLHSESTRVVVNWWSKLGSSMFVDRSVSEWNDKFYQRRYQDQSDLSLLQIEINWPICWWRKTLFYCVVRLPNQRSLKSPTWRPARGKCIDRSIKRTPSIFIQMFFKKFN